MKNKNEIDTVMQLWLNSTIKAHPFIVETYWKSNYEIIRDQYMPLSEVYVYVEDKMILGFVSFPEDSFIGALFVDVDAQGKGIGKQLIQHVKPLYDTLTLNVYKDNINALNFYKHMGFTIESESVNEETSKVEYLMRLI